MLLRQAPLIAEDVNQQTATDYILSGATAIGVGTELLPSEAIKRRQAHRIRELARRFLKLVSDARQEIEIWKKQSLVVVKEFTDTDKCEK